MALPKQRHTRHRRDRARKQYDVAFINIGTCENCQGPVLTHKVCPKCGMYKGRQVTATEALKDEVAVVPAKKVKAVKEAEIVE
jgi:large subunit ribosomal protein L32